MSKPIIISERTYRMIETIERIQPSNESAKPSPPMPPSTTTSQAAGLPMSLATESFCHGKVRRKTSVLLEWPKSRLLGVSPFPRIHRGRNGVATRSSRPLECRSLSTVGKAATSYRLMTW